MLNTTFFHLFIRHTFTNTNKTFLIRCLDSDTNVYHLTKVIQLCSGQDGSSDPSTHIIQPDGRMTEQQQQGNQWLWRFTVITFWVLFTLKYISNCLGIPKYSCVTTDKSGWYLQFNLHFSFYVLDSCINLTYRKGSKLNSA